MFSIKISIFSAYTVLRGVLLIITLKRKNEIITLTLVNRKAQI